MTELYLTIRGLDPLMFRDGRPFSTEEGSLAAHTLPLPLPGTIAGFLRTQLGNRLDWDWRGDGPAKALAVEIGGPLLQLNGSAVFAAPADAVIHKSKQSDGLQVMTLRPYTLPAGADCDMPSGLLPLSVSEGIKPESGFNFWPWEVIQKWLADPTDNAFQPPQKIVGLPREERVHVAIDSGTGGAKEKMLFTAQFVGFEEYAWKSGHGAQKMEALDDRWSLLARVGAEKAIDLSGPGTLGGERRLTVVETVEPSRWPNCTKALQTALTNSKKVRMVLATPAVFAGGWRPDWLDADGIGSPPGVSGLKLKLVSAAVRRREAVSGWDYKAKCSKSVRWLVPAGSVYFFEVEGDSTPLVEDCWLQSVSDNKQDQLDGYGLALWGVW